MMPISAPSAPDVLIGLTPQQCAAAIASGVLAGAGTGKTKTLTTAVGYRIMARRIPATRILAVTFTNKAAAEMTARIRTVLGGHTAPSWVGTFHGLGARQLRVPTRSRRPVARVRDPRRRRCPASGETDFESPQPRG